MKRRELVIALLLLSVAPLAASAQDTPESVDARPSATTRELVNGETFSVTSTSQRSDADAYWVAGVAGTKVRLTVEAAQPVTLAVFAPTGDWMFWVKLTPERSNHDFIMGKTGSYMIVVHRPPGAPPYRIAARYRDPTAAEFSAYLGLGFRRPGIPYLKCVVPGDISRPRSITRDGTIEILSVEDDVVVTRYLSGPSPFPDIRAPLVFDAGKIRGGVSNGNAVYYEFDQLDGNIAGYVGYYCPKGTP